MARVEIIAIGDELLRGDVVNTTTAFIREQLAGVGYELVQLTTVGDEIGRIVKAIRDALNAAEIVILTGGLGPTPDDVTREALARAIDQPLEFRTELWQEIQKLFRQRGRETSSANISQAYLPYQARAVPNSLGTACGIIAGHDGATIIALPGPPHELRQMVVDHVLPYLRGHYPPDPSCVTRSKTFKVYGIGESDVFERIRRLVEAAQAAGLKFSFYPRAGEVHLVITAAGAGSEAAALFDHLGPSLSNLLGASLYGAGEDTLPSVTGALLRTHGLTVGTAESCTGGLIAHYLTNVPGSSYYFRGGIVAYDPGLKERLLHVRRSTLDNFGVVSEQTAAEMAAGACKLLGSDFGLATTGLAGPSGGTPEIPVGTVYIGLASPDGVSVDRLFWPRLSRDQVKTMASKKAIDMLRRFLLALSQIQEPGSRSREPGA
jgi:nicotinamide-nucleotide amidase